MSEKKLHPEIESMIESFNERFEGSELKTSSRRATEKDRAAVTLWLPEEYKKKFDYGQKATNKELGKLICKIVMATLDRVSASKAS